MKNRYEKTLDSSGASKKKDELELSPAAKDYKFAMEKIKEKSDVREDKVKEIKMRVESGTYEINSKAIAEKIYNEIKKKKSGE